MMNISLAATVLSASAVAASTAPRGIGFARTVFNEQKLYYTSDAESYNESVFYSLDLTIPWPVSAPAWTKLPFNPPVSGRPLEASHMALSGNGSILYFFDQTMGTLSYDFQGSHWKALKYKNYQDLLGTFHAATTDTDDDLVYILEEPVEYAMENEVAPSMGWFPKMDWFPKVDTLLTLDMKTDIWSRERIVDLLKYTKGGLVLGWIYSSVRKSLVFLVSAKNMTLYEYHIPTKAIRPIIVTGDVPPVRYNAPIYSAYGGRKLVLASGFAPSGKMAFITGATKYTNDVHVFDLETFAWTRMADPPVEYTTAHGAVSGDHLVLYGTARQQETHAHGPGCRCDVGVHSVLNMKENVWADYYIPSRSSDE